MCGGAQPEVGEGGEGGGQQVQEEQDPEHRGPPDRAQPTEALHVKQRNTGENKHGNGIQGVDLA